MIRQLEETIATQEGLLRKAAEDMKFYKLELVNREKSYNEMFGANPMVGFIDPRLAKPQTGKAQVVGGAKTVIGGVGTSTNGVAAGGI